MKKPATIVLLLFLGILITVVVAKYLRTNTSEIVSVANGNALVVLAFMTRNKENQEQIIEQWADEGIVLNVINNCLSSNTKKNVTCIEKYVQRILAVTEDLDLPLVLLGEHQIATHILSAVDKKKWTERISALVFIQAESVNLPDAVVLPKVLLVNSTQDSSDNLITNRILSWNIRIRSNPVWFTLLDSQGDLLFQHKNLPQMILYFTDNKLNAAFESEFSAEVNWQHPPFNNDKFFQNDVVLKEQATRPLLINILRSFFHHEPYMLKMWPLKKYTSFDLLAYRESLPENKRGRFVRFTNRKGHQFNLDLDRYGRYEPEIVIAIDDENNLYRLTSFYKTKQFYSWQQGGPERNTLYAEPLGAFLHFRKQVPLQYELPYLQYSTILFDSITFSNESPYAELSNLSYPAFRVLTMNCLPCHKVGRVGGLAHHLDAHNASAQPGFAQPLLSYKKSVLKNFFFNQTATANLIGVNPNYVDKVIADELLLWLSQH